MLFPTAELVIPTGTRTNESNAYIETQPVIAEASFQYNLNTYLPYLYFLFIKL